MPSYRGYLLTGLVSRHPGFYALIATMIQRETTTPEGGIAGNLSSVRIKRKIKTDAAIGI